MSCPIQPPMMLFLDKKATLKRVKERKNEIKNQHLAEGGTKRNCPIKQSKTATMFAIFDLYLAKFDSKKRHKFDNHPRIYTQYNALGSKNDASGRTMQRHLGDLIEVALLRGYQRMQRGIQILLPFDLFVWAERPSDWHPLPKNSRQSSPSKTSLSSAVAGAAAGASASNDAACTAVSDGMAALALVRNHLGQLSAKIAQNSNK